MTKKETDILNEIKDNIEHHLDTKSDLKFKSFEGYDDRTGILKVDCWGHHVSGSYVHDWEVAPKYVEDLQYTSNRVVEWFPKRSSSNGFGSDIYHFLVYTHKVFNKGKYKPKGRLLRVENCYIAFDYMMGHEWASLYILYKAILRGSLPEDDFPVLFLEKYKEIVNRHLSSDRIHCTGVRYLMDWTSGDKIELRFDNGLIQTIGSDWYIFDKVDAEKILKRVDNIFIPFIIKRGRYYHSPNNIYHNSTLEYETSPKLGDIIDKIVPKERKRDNYGEFVPVSHFIWVNDERVDDLEMVLKSGDEIRIEI